MRCKCFKDMTFKQKFTVWYIIIILLFFTALQLTEIFEIVFNKKEYHLRIFLNIQLEFVLNMTYDLLVSSGFLYISFTLGKHAMRMNIKNHK